MAEPCTSLPNATTWAREQCWCGRCSCWPLLLPPALLCLPGWGKHQSSCPCLATGFPTAPSLLLAEQKRDVYDRYGKDGLMGAGEWASGAMGIWCSCGYGLS